MEEQGAKELQKLNAGGDRRGSKAKGQRIDSSRSGRTPGIPEWSPEQVRQAQSWLVGYKYQHTRSYRTG